MKMQRDLKNGQIEVVWNSGQVELIQTEGMVTSNGAAIVAQVKGHKIVIPLTSLRYFRVKAI